MRVIGVMNQKGGVGKTSTVLALATIAAAAGDRTLVADTDPQESCTWWHELLLRRGTQPPFEVVTDTDPAVLKHLRDVSDQFDTVIVDTPGSLQGRDVLSTIVSTIDYAIVPTSPAAFDLKSTIDTVRGLLQPASIPYRVLITRVDSRAPGEAQDAQETLAAAGVPHFRASIRQLKAHPDAIRDGRLITQVRDASQRKALEDYTAVAMEMLAEWARRPTGSTTR